MKLERKVRDIFLIFLVLHLFLIIASLLLSFVGLWGIVNNAGCSLPMGPSEWMRVEDFQNTLKVNLNGMISMTMTFLPLIKKARGRIVNVASVLGRVAANGGGYCISKFAVEAFSDCLRSASVNTLVNKYLQLTVWCWI